MESHIDSKPAGGGRPLIREWIVFAICLGVGGHVALGVILHAPDLWTLREAGLNGLLSGLAIYAAVQAGRWAWWMWKAPVGPHSGSRPNQ